MVKKLLVEPEEISQNKLNIIWKRKQINQEVNKYEEWQEKRDYNLAKTMNKALDIYYTQMVKKGNLCPSINTSVDSENEKAIRILRPQSALTFAQYMEK